MLDMNSAHPNFHANLNASEPAEPLCETCSEAPAGDWTNGRCETCDDTVQSVIETAEALSKTLAAAQKAADEIMFELDSYSHAEDKTLEMLKSKMQTAARMREALTEKLKTL